jgi:hypothetical protein
VPRTLSYTEISTALTCFAQWDFQYGGRLAGCTLKPRETAPRLSDGRAWGAGVAAWHAHSGELMAKWEAHAAILNSLTDDAAHMRAKGYEPDFDQMLASHERLAQILDHHTATTAQLPNLSMLEAELNVPIPSRGGKRGSNRYRFHCYLDGHCVMDGHPWIVEFKLRDNLTPRTIIERQPQYRWYAVAYALTHGIKGPVGVLIDETLNAAPAPARIVNAKRKGEGIDGKTVSHAVNQITTPDIYEAACREYGVEPEAATSAAFATRQWHQENRLVFTPADLAEGAAELTTAAKLIRDLDTGDHYPIRNGKRGNCNYCKFVGICPDPTNNYLLDSLFERTEPKRLRGPRPEGVR